MAQAEKHGRLVLMLELVRATREMRRLQKEYFKTKDRALVCICKGAEGKVDKILSQIKALDEGEVPPPPAPSLLDYLGEEGEPDLVGVSGGKPPYWANLED